MCIPAVLRRVKNNIPPHFCGRREREREKGGVTGFPSSFFHIYLNILQAISTSYLIWVTGTRWKYIHKRLCGRLLRTDTQEAGCEPGPAPSRELRGSQR